MDNLLALVGSPEAPVTTSPERTFSLLGAKLGRKARLEFCVQIFTSFVCSTDLLFSKAREPQLDASPEEPKKELNSWGEMGMEEGGRGRERQRDRDEETETKRHTERQGDIERCGRQR